MKRILRMSSAFLMSATVLASLAGGAVLSTARADDADAKRLVKAMSDYLAAQKSISFTFDTSVELVTKDQQKLQFASSGAAEVSRPDKIRVSKAGGFASMELIFDGKTLTLFGKDANLYAQTEAAGSIDQLIDLLQNKYHKPVPGADLLLSNVYDELMNGVTDIKDLGSGVIRGAECDHLAFRTKEVDWQIWIAQGDKPYPCKYVITSKEVDQAPQFSVELSDWQTGTDIAATRFSFENATNAKKVEPVAVGDLDDIPSEYLPGGAQ